MALGGIGTLLDSHDRENRVRIVEGEVVSHNKVMIVMWSLGGTIQGDYTTQLYRDHNKPL